MNFTLLPLTSKAKSGVKEQDMQTMRENLPCTVRLFRGSTQCGNVQNHMAETSIFLSWSCNLSAIRAINSEFVGLPLVLDTV